MTSTGRKGNHRSKKKRIALVMAPVTAAAMAASLMSQASAATQEEVERNCKDDSGGIEKCEFIDVQFKRNSYGPNEQVSPQYNNCGEGNLPTKLEFSYTTRVTRILQSEDGFFAEVGASVSGSLGAVGGKYATLQFDIKRDDKVTEQTGTHIDTVEPNHIGYIMWSAKRTDVSGYLKATYKNGDVSFSPSEGGTSVHVFYPQILKNGVTDGDIWLRNKPCPTPEQGGGGVKLGKARPDTAGFGEGGPGVIDVKIQR